MKLLVANSPGTGNPDPFVPFFPDPSMAVGRFAPKGWCPQKASHHFQGRFRGIFRSNLHAPHWRYSQRSHVFFDRTVWIVAIWSLNKNRERCWFRFTIFLGKLSYKYNFRCVLVPFSWFTTDPGPQVLLAVKLIQRKLTKPHFRPAASLFLSDSWVKLSDSSGQWFPWEYCYCDCNIHKINGFSMFQLQSHLQNTTQRLPKYVANIEVFFLTS